MTDPTPLDIVVISESQRQRDAVHQAQQGLTNTRVRQVTHPAELPGLKEPADIIICDKSVLGEVNDNVGRLKRDGKPIPTLVFEPPRPGAPHNFSAQRRPDGNIHEVAQVQTAEQIRTGIMEVAEQKKIPIVDPETAMRVDRMRVKIR
jgi:hypothetical protein